MGHSIHSYFSNRTQCYNKADYRIFVAEVASTVNEVLLLKHLYKKSTDKNVKKYLLNYYMDMIRTTAFRQTMFAEFEKDMYETCHHKYAALTDGSNGLAILNDCKYGYSAEDGEEYDPDHLWDELDCLDDDEKAFLSFRDSAFCTFLWDNGIGDLHEGNFGYIGNRMVIVDFSGRHG